MNAVNLIPGDARKRQVSVSASPATLGVIGGLLAVLVAAVLYVSAANDVTARKGELSQITASVASWQASANSYASLVASSQQRAAQLSSVKQLADSRFPWSQLLSQISGLMPANAALSTLQATTPTPTSSSSTTGATAAATPATPVPPTVALTGCAQSQSTVAQTMVQLHKITGVSAVTLATATDNGASSSAAPAPGQNAACPFPVAFQVSLTFATPSPGAASSSTTPAAPAATPASASTPASTPAAATVTNSNGAS